MKLLLLAGYLVFMIVIQVRTELVQAGTRLPFLINSQDLEAFEYVTITGCNNDCDTACCNCDISKQPPLCVLCCREDP
ncbi:hypothetical protein PRUPE_3G298000 [Prunus persica]|uniref:Uncharacterized protein n=1 Tax=Prunus persica TaxID=3760 RepID=M5WXI4_PRUPE|nr:hypothetical protein PRUPE_3G298000 [Prunus persica]